MAERPRQAGLDPEAIAARAALALRQEPQKILREDQPRAVEGGWGRNGARQTLLSARTRGGLRGGTFLHGGVAGVAAQRGGERLDSSAVSSMRAGLTVL